MDVPSPAAGKVAEVKVKVGDKVAEGTLILTLSTGVPVRRPRRHRPPRPAGARRGAEGGLLCRQRRHRMRNAGARRRSRRLLGGVPLRRSRHEDRARRALRDAGRRVPQRRLHSVEGAAAHRVGHGRSEGHGRARHQLTARRRSTSTSCAASRKAWSRSSPAASRGMAKARKVEAVRGIGRFLDPYHVEVESRRAPARTRPARRRPSGSRRRSSPPAVRR